MIQRHLIYQESHVQAVKVAPAKAEAGPAAEAAPNSPSSEADGFFAEVRALLFSGGVSF